jgi:parallel beta-helix repeat protein
MTRSIASQLGSAAVVLAVAACGNGDRSATAGPGSGASSGAGGSSGSGGAGPDSAAAGGAHGGAPGDAATSVYVLPSDRMADWIGHVGVEGGIPGRKTVRDCAALYGAHADGADTAGPINACLAGIGSGEVAYLPSGTYLIAASISVPSNKSLRGAGPANTVILANGDLPSGHYGASIFIGGGYTDASSGGKNVVSGMVKGSTQLALSDATGATVGGHLTVSELNDPSLPVSEVGSGGACTWCGVYGSNGKRARLQLAKITAVAGNTVTIDPPMYFTFSSALSPEVHLAPAYVEYAGVEDLTVKNGPLATSKAQANIMMQGAANSWIRNVRVDTCGTRCVDLELDVYRNEVRDSTLTHCVDHGNSDHCYGLQIAGGSGNLVENNVFDDTSDGIITVSASGNVIGYNYMRGCHRTQGMTQWFWGDNWTHGAHASYNLWEGNELNAIVWDVYWGSNSHDVAFRNRIHGHDETVSYDAYLQEAATVLTFYNNHVMTEVGNVLGTSGFHDSYEVRNTDGWTSKPIYATGATGGGKVPGDDLAFTTTLRHANFDYVTQSVKLCGDTGEPGCQGGGAEPALPASLYLRSRPAFFTSCEPWPPIGPDVPGYVSAGGLPAVRRLKGLPDPVCP